MIRHVLFDGLAAAVGGLPVPMVQPALQRALVSLVGGSSAGRASMLPAAGTAVSLAPVTGAANEERPAAALATAVNPAENDLGMMMAGAPHSLVHFMRGWTSTTSYGRINVLGFALEWAVEKPRLL